MTNTEITHGYLIAAGCLFTRGSFVKDVPYDQSLYFYGEELSIALRAFTRGYGIYHIPSTPIYHLYTDTSDLKGSFTGMRTRIVQELLNGMKEKNEHQ